MNNSENSGNASFNPEFCAYLEYRLSRAFSNSADKKSRWFWCDGIQMPLNSDQLEWKGISEKKEIATKAYAGQTGQDDYSMLIKFGVDALEKYSRMQNLESCVPDEYSLDWVVLDVDNKTISLQLL